MLPAVAVGSFCGGLSSLSAHDLGAITINEALQRAGVPASDVSEVILGHVLTAGILYLCAVYGVLVKCTFFAKGRSFYKTLNLVSIYPIC